VVYSAAILIEFAALLLLRKMEPDLPRPFKIPGGWPVVILVALLPAGMVAFAVINQFLGADSPAEAMKTFGMSAVALATGPVVYFLSQKLRRSTAHAEGPTE
jgi:amino acid transporter